MTKRKKIVKLFLIIIAVIFEVLLYWKAKSKLLFFLTMVIATGIMFSQIYWPYLL